MNLLVIDGQQNFPLYISNKCTLIPAISQTIFLSDRNVLHLLAGREIAPTTAKCLPKRQWGEVSNHKHQSFVKPKSERVRNSGCELLSWYIYYFLIISFIMPLNKRSRLATVVDQLFVFMFPGWKLSPCDVYQPNKIVLWSLLLGQPLQQHLVQMGKFLLLLSMLLVVFVLLFCGISLTIFILKSLVLGFTVVIILLKLSIAKLENVKRC